MSNPEIVNRNEIRRKREEEEKKKEKEKLQAERDATLKRIEAMDTTSADFIDDPKEETKTDEKPKTESKKDKDTLRAQDTSTAPKSRGRSIF